MARKKRLKQVVSAVALTAVVWTSPVWPASPAAAAVKPFGDVSSGYWAEKHIVKLALQGILSGKGDGIFAPNESIRREDAVIVALRFMGLADSINTTGSIAFPSTFQVDDYAKPYIQEAFKRKILSAEEEYALAGLETGKSWGKAPATREWVTRLLVRAIGKDGEAAANSGKTTSFSDDAKIDAKLKSYVFTGVQQGLIAGMTVISGGVTKTSFEPKQPINRAAIATLFSKAEAKLTVAYDGQVSGMLLSAAADKLTLLHEDGTVSVHNLTSGTLYARYDSDKPATAAGLKLYGKVSLISDGSGSYGYVEQTDDKAYVTTVDGTFSRLNASDSKVWLSVGNDFKSYSYDNNYEPIVTDLQNKPFLMKDIPEGAAVSLKIDTVRTEGKIIGLTVKQIVVNKSGSGTVVSWNAASGALKVSDALGTSEDLTVSPQATYKLGNVFVTKDQMKAGDSVTYEVKNSTVVSLQIAKPAVTTVSGKFFDLSKTNKTVTFTENGASKLSVEVLADNAAVKIDGLADAGYDDLQKDDNITLTYDGAGKVSQIVVSGRTVKLVTGATVEGYIAKTKTLSLSDANGDPLNLFLTANVRYESNGTKLDAATAIPMLTTGKKITLGYSGTNAITVSFIVKYTGTILEQNVTNKTLKLQLDPTNTVTVNYWNPVVEIYGQTNASPSNFAKGDIVTAVLNSSQDTATSVLVHKTVQFEVVSTDVPGAKFRTNNIATGKVEDWPISTSVVLQNEAGATAALGQFVPGAFVNVSFVGKSAVKFKTVAVTFGRVAAVNLAASTVDVALSNGTTATIPVGVNPLIMKDGGTLSSLSFVQPNDRIEVRKDENERTVIQVVPALNKRFWKYDGAFKTIDVQHGANETYSYTVESQTYIHQGLTTLKTADLSFDDPITLYIVRGKLLEVSK